MGQYAIPGFDCLGEAMMLGENGGAIAVWAPSGLSYNRYAEDLCSLMYDALFESGETVLGEALRQATDAYVAGARSGYEFIGQIFSLMGDPALRIGGLESSGMQVARTFDEWSYVTFTTSERQSTSLAGSSGDTDMDGHDNVMEYLFGRDPRLSEPSEFLIPLGPSASVGMPDYEATFEFTRRKNVGDYQFDLAVTTNLMAGWSTSTNGVVHTSLTDSGDGVTERVRIHLKRPANAAHIYLKLDVIGP